MRLHRTLSPIVFTLFLLFWPALVQADYLSGAKAFTFGDYATALKEWRPVAEQGEIWRVNGLWALYIGSAGACPYDQTTHPALRYRKSVKS